MLRKTLILTALIVLLTACAPQATPTPASLTFTDGLGREVTLATVSFRQHLEQIYNHLGLFQRIGRGGFVRHPYRQYVLRTERFGS